jgi:hypothetical protein
MGHKPIKGPTLAHYEPIMAPSWTDHGPSTHHGPSTDPLWADHGGLKWAKHGPTVGQSWVRSSWAHQGRIVHIYIYTYMHIYIYTYTHRSRDIRSQQSANDGPIMSPSRAIQGWARDGPIAHGVSMVDPRWADLGPINGPRWAHYGPPSSPLWAHSGPALSPCCQLNVRFVCICMCAPIVWPPFRNLLVINKRKNMM